MLRTFACAALAAASVMALAPAAFAHMTFETPHAAPGQRYKAVLRLPHGCDGLATDTVRVGIPDGFYNAQPMPKAGWILSTENGSYAVPFDNHGTEMTEGTREIVWSGGVVEDGWYDEFVFIGTFGADLSGDVTFDVVQYCGDASESWTPAVSLSGSVVPAEDHSAHHVAGNAVTAGDLVLSDAFTRATLPNAQVGGGYVAIENSGETDDRLIEARSPMAAEVQLHEMRVVNDVMQMRHLVEGIAIPAGETIELAPGGLHLMFMGITTPFVEGETVPVTLVFEEAGEIEVELAVLGFGAAAAEDHSSHEGHH